MRSNGGSPTQWGDEGIVNALNVRLISRVGLGILAFGLVIVALYVAKSVYADWLWFHELGFLDLYTKILGMRIWLFFGGTLLVAMLLLANLYVAYRFCWGESVLIVPPELLRLARLGMILVGALIVVVVSGVFGYVAQGQWEIFLIYFNRMPFGIEDPQFHKDMSFHVVVMPMLHFIQGWLMAVVITLLVSAVALYLAIFAYRGLQFTLTPKIIGHIAVLGAFLMVTIAMAHYLDIFELVFSGRGAAPGAGYTDVNARIPALWLLVAISLVSSVGFVVSLRYGGLRLMIASFSLWVVLAVAAGAVYPEIFQRFRVKPDEFNREEQYIQRAIDATVAAYNLKTPLLEELQFPYDPDLTPETVAQNLETIRNIRLWDHRPLQDTYNQIQTFRQFYNFVGVDSDRYNVPGEGYRQVLLSARELFPEELEEDAQNWINRKLVYTHGYGVAMSPVNRATEEGRPQFFLQDIASEGSLDINRPEIYYGENTRGFVIVNSSTDEFHFPGPEGDPVYTNYEGIGGVALDSLLRRATFAWKFLDFNLLISGQITSESKIQYRRHIQERVSAVVPFLRLDSDPYIVVGAEGKLWWIQDAYTLTDRYAYSERLNDEFNYIRNSVKIVVDAYDGTLHFFVIDHEDPLIQIYRKAFPGLFKNFNEISGLDSLLREHIRYPIDLFKAQTTINLRYHMRAPSEFFPSNDLWLPAKEVFESANNTQDIEPYYLIMKLPGEEKEEFVLLMPFTPAGERKNLVAWMAARSDGDNYGKLVSYIFPEGQVDGPEQIEGRITSDENIGRELSLLCPEGKLCIRGNLLAIPMGEEAQSILYVEPLYIRAAALPLPELKKVIVADAHHVVMSDTLEESLELLLGRAVTNTAQTPAEVPGTTILSSELKDVRKEITSVEDTVDELKKNLESLEEALNRMNEALGGDSQ